MLQRGRSALGMAGLLVMLASELVLASSSDMRRPPGEHRRPPQAAFDACTGKTEGAAVEVSTPGGTIKATCKPFDNQLVAVPEGAPPPPPSGNAPAAQ